MALQTDEISIKITSVADKAINTLTKLADKYSSLSNAIQPVTNALKKTSDVISSTTSKFKSLSNTADKTANDFRDKLKEALNLNPKVDISDAEKKLNTIKDKYDELKLATERFDNSIYGAGKNSPKGSFYGDRYQKDINKPMNTLHAPDISKLNVSYVEAKAQMAEYSKEMEKLNTEIDKTNGKKVDIKLSDVVYDIESATKALIVLNDELEKAKGTSNYENIKAAMKNIEKQFGITRKEALASSENVEKIGKSARRVGRPVNNLSRIFDKVKSSSSKIGSAFSGLGNKIQKVFGVGEHKLKKFSLGLMGIRTVMSFLTKSVTAYLSFDSMLQDSVSNSWNMMGALLGPAIEYVANMFAYATTYIYSFVKALTGIDLVARANAKAMATQAKATKGAAKEAQKALAPFDEIFNINQDKNAAGGGGSDLDLIEVPDIKANTIFDNLMKALKEGRWYDAGKIIADGINDALDSIPWNSIQKKAQSLGTNIAKFMNGSIENLDWNLLGSTIGNGIQTAIVFAYSWVTEFNFAAFGKGLGDSLNSAFASIDWAMLAQTIGKGIIGVFDTISNFLAEVDWQKIGEDVRMFLVNIPWKDIWESVKTAIKEAFEGFSEFIGGLLNIKPEDVQGFLREIGIIVAGIATFALTLKVLDLFKKEKGPVSDAVSTIGESFGNAAEKFGKAAEIIAVLGGLALVISSLTELFKTFSDSNMSLGEAAAFLGIAIGSVVAGFVAIAAASKMIELPQVIGIAVVFAGLSAVFLTLTGLMNSFANAGVKINDVVKLMVTIFGSMIVLMAAIALLGPAMTAGLIPFSILMLEISAVLIVMALTIPTILDAVGKFINTIAPPLIALLRTIGDIIVSIIYSLGTVLPPIIRSVGSLFKTIFDGISKVVNTVGNTIVKILNSAKDLTTTVLNAILNFINRLGPAINNFVNNAIYAVTRLINFMISGVEYMVNTLVIDGIRNMIKAVNKIPLVNLPVPSRVSVPRFVPKLETGTNRIEKEGLYHLHEDEAVVPKKYNPALGGGFEQDDRAVEETNSLLRALIDVVESKDYQPKIGVDDIGKASVDYIRKQRRVTGGSVI